MTDPNEYVAHHLKRMRQGQEQDAFFALIEGDPAAVPLLIEAFARDENRGIRARIVECVWQRRLPETVGFLAEALKDAEPAVWKQALDGLVTIGGSEVIRALEAARTELPAGRREWVDEALEQLGRRTPRVNGLELE